MLNALHPLHRTTLKVVVCLGLIGLLINAFAVEFEAVEEVEVTCIQRFNSSNHHSFIESSKRSSFSLHTWDLGRARPGISPKTFEYDVLPVVNTWLNDQGPVMVSLLGVRPAIRNRLKKEMVSRGGCWGYVPVWRPPDWLAYLSGVGIDLYLSILGPERVEIFDLEEQGTWFMLSGIDWSSDVQVERWSLVPEPGPWPRRLIFEQPAAVSITMTDSGGARTQLITVSLPDAARKHQAGALSIRSLGRSPYKERFAQQWVMIGDFRTSPHIKEAHPDAEFRFRRYSLENLLKQKISLINPAMDPAVWGRWRAHRDGLPEIIDYSFASEGKLTLLDQNMDGLKWVGPTEQRAPLSVSWSREE